MMSLLNPVENFARTAIEFKSKGLDILILGNFKNYKTLSYLQMELMSHFAIYTATFLETRFY